MCVFTLHARSIMRSTEKSDRKTSSYRILQWNLEEKRKQFRRLEHAKPRSESELLERTPGLRNLQLSHRVSRIKIRGSFSFAFGRFHEISESQILLLRHFYKYIYILHAPLITDQLD